MHITAQGPRLQNDLYQRPTRHSIGYTVSSGTLNPSIPYHTIPGSDPGFFGVSFALFTRATSIMLQHSVIVWGSGFCLLVVLSGLVVSSSASDWLERLVSEMTNSVLMGTLNPTHSLTRPREGKRTVNAVKNVLSAWWNINFSLHSHLSLEIWQLFNPLCA